MAFDKQKVDVTENVTAAFKTAGFPYFMKMKPSAR